MELVVGFEPTRAKPTAYKTVPIDLYGTPAYFFYMIYNDANLFVFRRLQEYLTVHYDESVFSIYVVELYTRWMPPTCYITMNKN